MNLYPLSYRALNLDIYFSLRTKVWVGTESKKDRNKLHEIYSLAIFERSYKEFLTIHLDTVKRLDTVRHLEKKGTKHAK